jgi:ribosomal protein S18 acetylase RimI-like enzyme
LELRPFDRDRYRQVRRAIRDAFRDHWGFADADPEEDYRRAAHHLDGHPHFDPELFFVLWDGDEVAGAAECFPNAENDPEKGQVAVLAVRKRWRGRGLGLGLLLHSFRAFWSRGIRTVTLTVDAESLTGATRLYEKAGMHVVLESATYDKKLRPGVELLNLGD